MIKINLAKRPTGKKASGPGAVGGGNIDAVSIESSGLDGEANPRMLVIKLAIILMGCAGLFAYEQANVPPLRAKARKIREELATVKKKNDDNVKIVQESQGYEKDQDRLQSQINAIEKISKNRLREVRVLDYIQKEIPEKVWLQKMNLTDGTLHIHGYATADSELTTFMEGLQRSAYLKNVLLVLSTEATTPDMGTVKKFEISCVIERAL